MSLAAGMAGLISSEEVESEESPRSLSRPSAVSVTDAAAGAFLISVSVGRRAGWLITPRLRLAAAVSETGG